MRIKIVIFTIFILTVFNNLFAIPAMRISKDVIQKDGSCLSIHLVGDESLHFYITNDGIPLIEASDGSFYYSKVDNNEMISTGILAHEAPSRSLQEQSYLTFSKSFLQNSISSLWSTCLIKRNAVRLERAEKNNLHVKSKHNKLNNQPTEITKKKGLVILVNFNNLKMASKTANTDFNTQFNQSGYNKNGHIGCVKDYFRDQSYGQLSIDFDVVGPYLLSGDMEYYGKNKSNGDDMYAAQMVSEACQMADDDVNFKDYDWDGDGEVEQVYVVYAGFGESSGAPSQTIWPHEWSLSSARASGDGSGALTLDGVKVDTYACSNELAGTSGSIMDGIGTACHEFSHCLGLPDLYDTSGHNFGMDCWSVMDYGCYNGPNTYSGSVPCAYTGYERYFAGWLNPTVLDKGCNIEDMASITDSDDCYIIYNANNDKEYYMLFNIQQNSWNQYAKGHGMLVMHIDYDKSIWSGNTVNNTSNRQRCTIIAADDKYSSGTLSGDPFPGSGTKTELTNTSVPASILYNNNIDGTKLLNKPIVDIKESDNGLISFMFNGGKQLYSPIATEGTEINENGFTANWTKVADASSYALELQEIVGIDLSILLNEDFSGFSVLGNNIDITTNINKWTNTDGWSGRNIFTTGSSYIKLGNSLSNGMIVTPPIEGSRCDKITVYIKVTPYSTINPANLDVTYGGQTITLSSKGEGVAMVFPKSNNSSISISTTSPSRAYINQIFICDGETNASDIESFLFDEKAVISIKSTKSTLYPDIQTNSYKLTNLYAKEYYYRVKAVNSKGESEWSNTIEIKLADATDIDIPLKDEIFPIEIYSTNGILVKRENSTRFLNNLSKGIYIVKQNKTIYKIIIH